MTVLTAGLLALMPLVSNARLDAAERAAEPGGRGE